MLTFFLGFVVGFLVCLFVGMILVVWVGGPFVGGYQERGGMEEGYR